MTVGEYAFQDCWSLSTTVFRARVSVALIAWVVANSRNRTNWQITTVEHLRNVLRLITELAVERRDVASLDPGGLRGVFNGCINLHI